MLTKCIGLLILFLPSVLCAEVFRSSNILINSIRGGDISFNEKVSALSVIINGDRLTPSELSDAYAFRAEVYKNMGLLLKAQDDVSMSLKLNQTNLTAMVVQTMVDETNGNHSNIVSVASKALSIDSGLTMLYLERGRAYLALGRYTNAIEDLSYILDDTGLGNLSEWSSFAYEFRGMANAELNRTKEAIQDLTAAIKLGRKAGNLFVWRAQLYEKSGQYALAISDYKEALSLNMEDFFPPYALAKLYCSCPENSIRDGELAVYYARMTRDIATNVTNYQSVELMELLACAKIALGDYQGAVSIISQAMSASDDNEQKLNLSKTLKEYKSKLESHNSEGL